MTRTVIPCDDTTFFATYGGSAGSWTADGSGHITMTGNASGTGGGYFNMLGANTGYYEFLLWMTSGEWVAFKVNSSASGPLYNNNGQGFLVRPTGSVEFAWNSPSGSPNFTLGTAPSSSATAARIGLDVTSSTTVDIYVNGVFQETVTFGTDSGGTVFFGAYNGAVAFIDEIVMANSYADAYTVNANTLHESVHAVSAVIPLNANTLHESVHVVSTTVVPTAQTLHTRTHLAAASRLVANSLHTTTHLARARSPVQVRTLHTAVHNPSAGTFAYPGGFPPAFVRPRRLEYHLLGRDGHDFGILTKDRNRHFQHVLNDTGSGRAEVRFTEPLSDELRIGRVLSCFVDGSSRPVFDILIEPGQRDTLTSDEAAGQGRIVGGRGTLAVLGESRIGPQQLAGAPIEHVIVFDFSHPAYVEQPGEWVAATQIAGQGYFVSPLWQGKPAQWPVPSAVWIWSSDGTAADAPGPATRYFRRAFPFTPGKFVAYTAGDNAYEFSKNGTPIVGAADLLKTTGAFWRGIRTPIDISTPAPGLTVFGIKGTNYAPTVPGSNPAGVLAAIVRLNADGIEIGPQLVTDNGWHVYADMSDGAFPGITVGMAMIWILNQAKVRGGLEHVTWDFDEFVDSAGVAWPLVERITANVGQEPLTAILSFVEAGLCDVQMEPGSPFNFQAYNFGTLIPASTATFDEPNFEELHYSDPPAVVNAYLVQYDAGFFWLDDDAAIAANDGIRIESYLSMGDATGIEAIHRTAAQLDLTKDAGRSQITVKLAKTPSVRPYATFGVGSIVPTRQEDGSVADERVTSIAIADADDGIDVIPTLRAYIPDDEDRRETWLGTIGNGARSGNFRGWLHPPQISIPLSDPTNEGEIIHQEGALRLGLSPRHPIRRTGTARQFYLFLGGLLGSANIDVTCLINDVPVAFATIIAGARRSPLVEIASAVDESDDWWSINATGGVDGSDLQAHLIIG